MMVLTDLKRLVDAGPSVWFELDLVREIMLNIRLLYYSVETVWEVTIKCHHFRIKTPITHQSAA